MLDMETVTLKLERRQIQKLQDRARASGRSQAAVVRELIDRHLGDGDASLHDRAQDLCGTLPGSRDLSTRGLKGYGRD
jgi:hypothetical protein